MNSKTFAFRLHPTKDLKIGIEEFVSDQKILAGFIITCVGSLTDFHLRFANQQSGTRGSGHYEIVSLVGTLSTNGSHLHIALANESGSVFGGHLLDGCKIYTTAEIVIGVHEGFIFEKEIDSATGYRELTIKQKT